MIIRYFINFWLFALGSYYSRFIMIILTIGMIEFSGVLSSCATD